MTDRRGLAVPPHHDGSSAYVTDRAPSIGDRVTVRLAAPPEAGVTAVHLWTTVDGEGRSLVGVRDGSRRGEDLWAADLDVRNTTTRYRFHVTTATSGYWVTGAGRVDHDPTQQSDFRIVAGADAPRWALESTFLQVFPDRFAASGAAGGPDRPWPAWARPARWTDPSETRGEEAMRQLYGGDLDGIAERLDHVATIADALYLTPIFPAASNHRYDAASFDHVDPLLGGDVALARLVRALRSRGMHVIGDLTANHCGRTHPWAVAALRGDEPERSMFHRGPDGSVETWLGVPTLPKFDHRSPELRRRLYEGDGSVAARWLAGPDGLDGWRLDVANMAGRSGPVDRNHELAVAMRATVSAARSDAYLVAEHTGDATGDLDGTGWHGTMAYAPFRGPVMSWLGGTHRSGTLVARSMREFVAAVPWRCTAAGLTLLGSHDTPRLASLLDRSSAAVARGLLHTMPGIPMTFAGDEWGAAGDDPHAARAPLDWTGATWDGAVLDDTRAWVALRRELAPLRSGGLRWLATTDDALVYSRETHDAAVVVHAARQAHPPTAVTSAALAGCEWTPLRGAPAAARVGSTVTFTADGPGVHAWLVTGG